MATRESMAIRANAACKKIEEQLKRLGVNIDPLPLLHRDREMLRSIQLELIADALTHVELSGNNTLDQLKAIVSQSRYTKSDIESVLYGNDNSTD